MRPIRRRAAARLNVNTHVIGQPTGAWCSATITKLDTAPPPTRGYCARRTARRVAHELVEGWRYYQRARRLHADYHGTT